MTVPRGYFAGTLLPSGKVLVMGGYNLVNFEMTLQGFKSIFWWEYFHRVLGRAIGFVFLVPLLFFQLKRKLERPLAFKLWGVFALGALLIRFVL